MQATYAVAEAESIARPSPSFVSVKTPVGPIRVLHIEDDPDQAALVNRCLTGDCLDRYCVEWVDKLVLALDRLSEPGVDVVLLDLGMPELAGYKSHVAVRAVAPSLPIVVLTGDRRDTSRQFSLLSGATSYLIKDQTSPGEIRHAIREALSLREGR